MSVRFHKIMRIRNLADRVGGIIALRDGLDAANVSRFPAAQFGPWGHSQQQHVARLQAIAAAFAHRGAGEHDRLSTILLAGFASLISMALCCCSGARPGSGVEERDAQPQAQRHQRCREPHLAG